MKNTYDKALTGDDLDTFPDYDANELGESFWENARIVMPKAKQAVSLRLPPDVVAYFKAKSPTGYTSHMAAVLAAYVAAQSNG